MRAPRGPTRSAARAYVPVMLDGRTSMAKHTKSMIGLLFGLIVLAIALEALG